MFKHWELFEKINAIFTLVPALLGLKGNLEMTLASRFSTQVMNKKKFFLFFHSNYSSFCLNFFSLFFFLFFLQKTNLGKISDRSTILSAVLGNLALTQAQAIVVGFLASIGAIILKALGKDFNFENSLVLIAGSVSTASFASLILGRKKKIHI